MIQVPRSKVGKSSGGPSEGMSSHTGLTRPFPLEGMCDLALFSLRWSIALGLQGVSRGYDRGLHKTTLRVY